MFYSLNLLLLFSGLSGVRLSNDDQRFTLALIRNLLTLPLLSAEYFYLVYHFNVQATQLLFFSEIIFSLIWLSMALRIRNAMAASVEESRREFLFETIIEALIAASVYYYILHHFEFEIVDNSIVFLAYNPIYVSSFFILIAVLYTSWQLEQFWRTLNVGLRCEYKFLLAGSNVVCGAFAWTASYRLTYLAVPLHHCLLLALFLVAGWLLMFYAVSHHRLLNRKIFISRKIVYSFVVPSLLAAYLFVFGVTSLMMRTFGLELSFVLKWFLLILGCAFIVLVGFSERIRSKVHFFISTHFYVNKYEYRDEWLALSQHLQGALTEVEVVQALQEVLSNCLYTTRIYIWLGDASRGYKLVSSYNVSTTIGGNRGVAGNDALVEFLQQHSYFHLKEKEPDQEWRRVFLEKKEFLKSFDIVLLSPVSIGNQLIGIIGLGPEYTGGQYGYDDFDLLTVVGTQTASALLAVRMSEKLALAREQQAWNRLSAFVLHDIKNAATMLSLLRENGPEHIHEPEFQQDMLELVDDALRRMGRVEQRLQTLKEEVVPEKHDIRLKPFLLECKRSLQPKLPGVNVTVKCKGKIPIVSDRNLLVSILENLLINAFEAMGSGIEITITAVKDTEKRQAVITIMDNGPGIKEELLPDLLFKPFKTGKKDGSGIGLWQVKRIVTNLKGTIIAENHYQKGAIFTLRLPLA